MTMSLTDLSSSIIADGVVDAVEVKNIEERVYADGVIDRDEANFLFAVNDGVSGNDNHSSFKDLFVKALTEHVLDDDTSPGEVDENESAWLISKIKGDGEVDANEKALLENIKANAKSIHDSLATFITSVI